METHGQSILLDYGIAPDKPPEYPLEAPPIDQAILTHAHLDHSGMIPALRRMGVESVMATPVTAEVSTLMHQDSLKIARIEGYPEPFSDPDIRATERSWDHVDFRHPRRVADSDLEVRFHSAGHIPGAAQVELRGKRRMVFTGDLYTRPQRLVGAGKPVRCDILCMETTYAGREHPDRTETERRFIDFVDDNSRAGGTTVAAVFAVGRAQEIAMVLADQGFNVWMDGMARRVSQIYRRHPQFLADAGRYERAIGDIKYVRGQRGRSIAMKEADVIITTSGMLEGGPILYYADKIRNDRNSGIALTGYQVRGTNGRRLMDEGHLDMDPHDPGHQIKEIHCRVEHFDFSAHAGHQDMVEFAKATGADDVVLFHGDNREALVEDLSANHARVHLPEMGETFHL